MKIFTTVISSSLIVGLATTAHAADYKVGLTATYSGDFAAFGQSLRNGAELAIRKTAPADVTITFDVIDDKGSPQEGVLAAQRLCSDKDVVAVLGYTFSSVALAAVPILDECKLPVVASAVTSPDLSNSSPYFRRNVMTDAEQGRRMGEFAVGKLQAKNIYILNQQDDYGIGVANAFAAAVTEGGATVAGTEAYHLGDNNFRTVLTKVKAESPDAIFIGGFYSEAAKILEQARQIGVTAQFLGTDGSLNSQLLALSKGAAEGLVVYGMFDPSTGGEQSRDFVTAYRDAYKTDPDVWSALGYDAAGLLASTIGEQQKAGTVTREGLNAALSAIDGYAGVTGAVSFSASGDRQGDLFFFQVKDNKFVPVEAH